MTIESREQDPGSARASRKSRGSPAIIEVVVAGHETLRRIRAYIEDGDVDAHESLRSDVERLYNLMIRWRIAAQRWTPGGSEYMDPVYCERFIAERRLEAHRSKAAAVFMERALRRIEDLEATTAPTDPSLSAARQIARETLCSLASLSSEAPPPACERSEQCTPATDEQP